jgi:hypothetical protein
MTMPTRAEWTIAYPGTTNKVDVETYYIFGWKCHRHLMPSGSKYIMFAERDYQADEQPNRSIFVKGRAKAEHSNGTVYEDRVPGHYSQDRGMQPAGLLTTTALEDTEMWCINFNANNKALPGLTPVVLAAGESFTFTANSLAFLMHGSLDDGGLIGPKPFVPTDDMTLTADTASYLYLFDKARDEL